MGFTPYDWNENIVHRMEYVEARLRQGSPVVGLAFESGLLLLSVRRSHHKVFEVFDHIIYSAIGSQSDVEAVRIASIDFAHQEGFSRSPDDVSVQRLAAGLSTTLKKAFADGFSAPFTFRGIFAELGRSPEQDRFTVLNYDGEYSSQSGFAAISGSRDADQRMTERLEKLGRERLPLPHAVHAAAEVWTEGISVSPRPLSREEEDESEAVRTQSSQELSTAVDEGMLEVGILERRGDQIRFRLLNPQEVKDFVLTPNIQ